MTAAPTLRIKYLAAINPESLAEETEPERRFRYVDISSVGRGELVGDPQEMTFATAPSRARRLVCPGDTVVSTVRTYLRAVWPVPVDCEDLVVSTGFAVLRPGARMDARFFAWVSQSDSVIEEIVARSVGVSYPAINASDIGDLRILVPVLRRQRAIAEYLDRETARIDALIGAKRRMVGLLAERLRRAVSETTCARLTVDSSSEPPPGWRMIPLRRCLGAADYGIGDPSQSQGDYAVLGMTNITAGEVLGPPGGFVSAIDERLLLCPGDLLFNRTNSRELVGKVGLVRSVDRPTTFASYLVRLRANQQLGIPEYLNYVLNSREVLGLARSIALPSIGQANLNPSRYSAIVLPIPPIDEQVRLASGLDGLAAHATAMKQTIDRQVDLLAERRQALITAAVTGQLAIPEAA